MGVPGSYQETPSSPKLSSQSHPAPFFFTSHSKTPSTPVGVVPSPFHPAPFSAFSPPPGESPFLYSLSFHPSPWASALGAAPLCGGATWRHPQDCFWALSSQRVAGAEPGARQGPGLRACGRGRVPAPSRSPCPLPPPVLPSLPPSLAAGHPEPRSAQGGGFACPAQLLYGGRSLFPSSLRHVGHLIIFFLSFFVFKKFLL